MRPSGDGLPVVDKLRNWCAVNQADVDEPLKHEIRKMACRPFVRQNAVDMTNLGTVRNRDPAPVCLGFLKSVIVAQLLEELGTRDGNLTL